MFTMINIDEAINREMGSVFKRAYVTTLFLYVLVDFIHAPQIMLIMFIAPPNDTFTYNPNAYNAKTIISEWNLTDAEIQWIPGLLQSIFFVGFMVGTILFGQLSDKYGRKSVSWKVYTGTVIIGFSAALCQNWQQLLVCRILGGFGIGGLGVMNTIMLQEMSAARMWNTNGALGGIFFTTSMFVFLTIAYYFPSWRTLCIVSTAPSLLGYIFYLVMPESPRWLVSHGRLKEANGVIETLARRNGHSQQEYDILLDGTDSVSPSRLAKKQSIKEVKNSIMDLVRYPVLRYRTAVLSFQWFTTSFIFYCITLGAGSFSPNFYLAFGMSAISQLPAIPIGWYFMGRTWCGRKRTLAGLMFLTASSMFAMYILPHVEANAHYRLLLSMVAKVGTSGCFNLIYVYTPELYPTVVRNVGLGCMSTCARIGSMTAPFLATFTVNSGSDLPFLIFGILSGLSGVLALILPETRGKRIMNTIQESYEQEEEIT